AGAGLTRLALQVEQTLRPAAINPALRDQRELGIAIGELTLRAADCLHRSADPNDADAPFFFLHIPETAGLSLSQQLARRIGQEPSPQIYVQSDPAILAQAGQSHYLSGHIGYDMGCTLLGRNPIGLTMLREPLER